MEARSSPAPLSSANSMSKDEEATEAEVATLAEVQQELLWPWAELLQCHDCTGIQPHVGTIPWGKKMHGPFGLSGSLEPVDSFFGALLGFFLS